MPHTSILALRRSRGLTQEELAEKAGVTVRTIQRIESGETVPRAYTLKRIAEAVGVQWEELHSPEPAMAPPAPETVSAPAAAVGKTGREELYLLNMSCFFYLVIPFIHALIPYHLWKKSRGEAGWKIVRSQVSWTIALHGSMLLTLAYNLVSKYYFRENAFLVNYLWVFFSMYTINAIIILRANYRITTGKCRV